MCALQMGTHTLVGSVAAWTPWFLLLQAHIRQHEIVNDSLICFLVNENELLDCSNSAVEEFHHFSLAPVTGGTYCVPHSVLSTLKKNYIILCYLLTLLPYVYGDVEAQRSLMS